MKKYLLFMLLVLVPQLFVFIISLASVCNIMTDGIYNNSDEAGKMAVAKDSLSPYIYDIMIDGIYYKLDEGKQVAKVTCGDNDYTGDIKM